MKHPTATSVLTLFLILLTITFASQLARAQGDCGILVATTGADGADCGLNPGDPCATISNGISRAQALGLSCVFVQAGVYPEVLVLVDGVDVIGGYDTSWTAGDHGDPAHRVEVVGGIDAGSGGKYLTVRAHGITQTTRVSNLVLTGPDAVGQVGSTGKNAYVVHAVDASVLLENLEINAGNGANGLDGSDGGDAPTVTATALMNGTAGGSAAEYASTCDASSHGIGGAAGTNGAAVLAGGGHGGNGGEMDTSCICAFGVCSCDNCAATSGDYGSDAAVNSISYGQGGSAGSPCFAGSDGFAGRVLNGNAGGGGSGGALASDDWLAQAGTDGGLGQDGGGGGGGGGSGGCDTGTDSYGAGGGGGAAGGQHAVGAGAGGGGGGSSFAVFAINSGVALQDCVITRGNGGTGGSGGAGGRGQDGGLGGAGGAAVGDSQKGGDGGDGGHGGHGGGGGGGAGGVSYGIYGDNSLIIPNNTIYSGGGAGAGGAGGISAPSAPIALQDGNDGTAGTAGTVGNLFPGGTPDNGSHSVGPTATCSIDPCLAVAAPAVKATRFFFSQASPNPAGSEVFFQLELVEPSPVHLNVYGVSGRRVLEVANRTFAAGSHTLRINTRGLSSGTYFALLEAAGRKVTRKMLVVR